MASISFVAYLSIQREGTTTSCTASFRSAGGGAERGLWEGLVSTKQTNKILSCNSFFFVYAPQRLF